MQGMPAKILPPKPAKVAAKVESFSPVSNNKKVEANPEQRGRVTSSSPSDIKETKSAPTSVGTPAPKEDKGAFASLFEGLLGNSETNTDGKEVKTADGKPELKLDGKTEGKEVKGEGKAENKKGEVATADKAMMAAEAKVDTLLKNKDLEKSQKPNTNVLSTEKALPADVLKNINNLIDRSPIVEGKTATAPVGEKVAATTTNLDQLLKTLKNNNAEVEVLENGEGADPKINTEAKKTGSPLDFLLKQSQTKGNEVGKMDSKEGKLLETNPEAVSKLGLSSEDFLSHMSGAKENKELKNAKVSDKSQGMMNLDNEGFDPQALLQKQANLSMKAYGQKQNLLNDNVIRSPKDLMNKDSKIKSTDELKSPDMKIGAELAGIKETVIPLMQKQEQGQAATTQGSEKVLDLSKMNTSNPTEIIKKISDYVQQSQVANKDSLDLTVKHDSLGQFKIQVNKPMGANTQMDMQITTSTAEGHDFFMKNEIGLMKNLSQAGIQLSDLRIVSESGSSAFAGNDSRQNSHSQNAANFNREFMSFENGDSSNGADRRKELWQEARNNQQRYGA
jgi:hypothetical protein